MAETGAHRIFLLAIFLTKFLEGAKLLADFKKCADLECETLISRVLATRDYRGPDCRYLNFTKGEEISVYIKLAGEREDLWAGSKGKDFGYFPRDAVLTEEVFISEEIQMPTKESDFLCLLGVSYTFENEDSESSSGDGENIYTYEEDKDQKSSVYGSDFQIESEFYSAPKSIWNEDQFTTSEAPDDTRTSSDSKNSEAVEAGSVKQDPVPEGPQVPPSSTVPDVRGWFGFGSAQAEENTFEPVIEQESSFQSKKIAVEDEDDLEELNNGEPQTEHTPEPESEFSSVPKKQPEASESEHTLNPQVTSWFGGGFTSYLGFGGEDKGLELSSKESNPSLQDVPNSISSEEEPTYPCTEILSEKEDTITNDSSVLKPGWFDLGFSMLGFAYANEDKIVTYNGKNEEGYKGDKHEQLPISESDLDKEEEIKMIRTTETKDHPTSESNLDKEEEIKMIRTTETKDQLGKDEVLEKTDDSDTLPYLTKLLYNFDNPWNFQKETEFPVPKKIMDEKNVFENDEKEEFSVENDPTVNIKVMMLKSRYSKSEMISKMELPIRTDEDLYFETLSSINNDERSKASLDIEELIQEEIDKLMENTLPNSEMFSTDYSLSSQNYIAQKDDASEGHFLKFLFQIGIYDFMNSAFSSIVIFTEVVLDQLN